MVCRVEPRLMWPVKHRDKQAYADMGVIKARDVLVQNRVRLINHVEALQKPVVIEFQNIFRFW